MFDAIDNVASFPEAFPVVYRTARRIRLKVFPYNLYYVYDEKAQEVLVVACTHAHRSSEAWQDRI